jgi:hypothetical protein
MGSAIRGRQKFTRAIKTEFSAFFVEKMPEFWDDPQAADRGRSEKSAMMNGEQCPSASDSAKHTTKFRFFF